jgi:hypothetical protein
MKIIKKLVTLYVNHIHNSEHIFIITPDFTRIDQIIESKNFNG